MSKEPTAVDRLREQLDGMPDRYYPINPDVVGAIVEIADKLDGLRKFVFAFTPKPPKKKAGS